MSKGETIIQHVSLMPTATIKDQFNVLGSISNFHWWSYFTIDGMVSEGTRPRFSQFVHFYPGMKQDKAGVNYRPKHLPVSPRNQMIFYRQNQGYTTRYRQTLCYLLKDDLKQADIVKFQPQPECSLGTQYDFEDDYDQRSRSRRYTTRVLKGDPRDLFEEAARYETVRSSVPQISLYNMFTQSILTTGTIVWRRHCGETDIVAMSDYCCRTGQLKSLDFVHVVAQYPPGDPEDVLISCSCKIYKHMQSKALRKQHLESSEDAVLDATFTCMHCRFFKEYMYPIRNNFGDPDRTSQIHKKLQSDLDQMNNPIVLLGKATIGVTTKFSVAGVDNSGLEKAAMVHLHFGPQGCFVRCQDGTCQATSVHHRVGLPKAVALKDLEKKAEGRQGLCPHLRTVYSNLEYISDLFPGYFGQEEGGSQQPVLDDVNADDFELENYDSKMVFFDPTEKFMSVDGKEKTGMWKCNSHSQYRTEFDRYNPSLVSSAAKRLACVQGELVNGFYVGPTLEAPNDGPCPCGAGYGPASKAQFRKAKVYTHQVRKHVFVSFTRYGTLKIPYSILLTHYRICLL